MLGQGRADRRALERQRLSDALTFQRERQARVDAFAIKRFELDRETLIELQQILLGLHQAILKDHEKPGTQIDLNAVQQLNHVRLLESRVMGDAVRSSADSYLSYAEKYVMHQIIRGSGSIIEEIQQRYNRTQRAVGDALRINPLRMEMAALVVNPPLDT